MKKIVLALVALMLLAFPATVYAKIRTGAGGDVPFYARIALDETYHTDEWAVIVFYRPPECVPPDFNLLDFFDPGAFACSPYTTDGFTIWAGEPGISTPIQVNLHGLGAVPVWFVSWPELQGTLADNILTMPELMGMNSLMTGSASFYQEVLHPSGGAQVSMGEFQAKGLLDDGRQFNVYIASVPVNTNVRIDFK